MLFPIEMFQIHYNRNVSTVSSLSRIILVVVFAIAETELLNNKFDHDKFYQPDVVNC
jgi:hypothetical protein